MTHSHAAETVASSAGATATRALRVLAALSVLMIVLQGASAGLILSRDRSAVSLHFDGAIVVHVLTGLTALVAFLVARRERGPWWPTALAVVVFAVGFVQAAIGEAGILAVHVPLAMLLLVAAVTVMVWTFRRVRT